MMVAGKVGNYFFHPISSILIFCLFVSLSWEGNSKNFLTFFCFFWQLVSLNITTQEIVLSQLQSIPFKLHTHQPLLPSQKWTEHQLTSLNYVF